MREKTCEECDSTFSRDDSSPTSDERWTRRRFCSMACLYAHIRRTGGNRLGAKASKETRQKISEAAKRQFADPSQRERISKRSKELWADPAWRQHQSEVHQQSSKRGPECNLWHGGIKHHSSGYILVNVPGHPSANRDGYIYEHRLVAEETLRRELAPEERVHHLDGDKGNNNPSNLLVFPSNGEHARHHMIGNRHAAKN